MGIAGQVDKRPSASLAGNEEGSPGGRSGKGTEARTGVSLGSVATSTMATSALAGLARREVQEQAQGEAGRFFKQAVHRQERALVWERSALRRRSRQLSGRFTTVPFSYIGNTVEKDCQIRQCSGRIGNPSHEIYPHSVQTGFYLRTIWPGRSAWYSPAGGITPPGTWKIVAASSPGVIR